MHVRLLGTGSADGWPNPWCTCASCAAVRGTADARGQTSALVDGTLLVDAGPDVGRAAQRYGVSLAGLRTLLLTHAHPDHADPALLLWRQWVPGLPPLQVAGPAAALDRYRDWVGRDDPVTWLPLRAGDDVVLASGHRARPLAAVHDPATGPPLLYDLLAPDGGRLLCAWDTAAPLPPPPPPDPPYDIVLLECTNGDGPALGEHHGFTQWALAVAGLRRSGHVAAGTTVVPVHLGHRNPPPPELHRRFAGLGAVVLRDGDTVSTGVQDPSPEAAAPGAAGARRVLITGGTRSGKSLEAERRLLAEPVVTYVATSLPRPGDAEWAARLALHRARRPVHWRTVETLDLPPLLADPAAVLLIDCVTLWLGAHLEREDLGGEVDRLVEAWRTARARVVLVTNEVGSAVVAPTPLGRRFADELGRLNSRLAAHSDEVWQVVAGCPVRLR